MERDEAELKAKMQRMAEEALTKIGGEARAPAVPGEPVPIEGIVEIVREVVKLRAV